jgi:hypothetical protein
MAVFINLEHPKIWKVLDTIPNRTNKQLKKLYWDKLLTRLNFLLPVLVLVFITKYFDQLRQKYKMLGSLNTILNPIKRNGNLFLHKGQYLGEFMFRYSLCSCIYSSYPETTQEYSLEVSNLYTSRDKFILSILFGYIILLWEHFVYKCLGFKFFISLNVYYLKFLVIL